MEQGENMEKKVFKDRVRKLLDQSNVIEINPPASFCKCDLCFSSLLGFWGRVNEILD